MKLTDTGLPMPEVEPASGVKRPTNVAPGDLVVNVDTVSPAAPAASAVTVYFVPE
ncbi:hypothetical protein FB157_103597 [Streptomyces sp. BK340]|nr:hypothetical protein FB157_103597 [Streptomyces sp. BK340]